MKRTRQPQPRGASPTHTLRILDKETDAKATIGVGWYNPDNGSVSIKLNAHVVLSEYELRNSVMTLFPSDWEVKADRTMTIEEQG